MSPALDTSLAHGAPDAAAPPALAPSSEPDHATHTATEPLVARIDAYGFHSGAAPSSGVWWVPFRHPSSVSPLATGVRVEWAL